MALPEYVDDTNVSDVFDTIELLVARPDAIEDASLDWLVEMLVKGQPFRPFIAERISKIGSLVEGRLMKILLTSDDNDLLVNCSLLLFSDGNTSGIAFLLRAVATGHPLQIIITQRLAERKMTGLSEAISIAYQKGLFERFAHLIPVLSSLRAVNPLLSRALLEDFIQSKNPDTRFYEPNIEQIRTLA